MIYVLLPCFLIVHVHLCVISGVDKSYGRCWHASMHYTILKIDVFAVPFLACLCSSLGEHQKRNEYINQFLLSNVQCLCICVLQEFLFSPRIVRTTFPYLVFKDNVILSSQTRKREREWSIHYAWRNVLRFCCPAAVLSHAVRK